MTKKQLLKEINKFLREQEKEAIVEGLVVTDVYDTETQQGWTNYLLLVARSYLAKKYK
jgi:hypothetical protein